VHQLGEPELGVVGSDAQVAGERHLQPAAQGEAVDGGDGRLRQRRELVDVAAGAQPVAPLGGRLGGAGLLQVHAGAEEAVARSGQHDHRDLIVRRDAGPDGLEFVAHLLVAGVGRVRALQADPRHRAVDLHRGRVEPLGPGAGAHDLRAHDSDSIFLPSSP
jgi:hypothetical protein